MAEEAPTTETSEQRPNLSLLAQEMFGDKYHGEVQQPEPPEEPQEETPEETSEEAPEETEEVSEETTEETSEEAPEEATEHQDFELSQIAQLLGVDESALDVDDDGTVVFAKKVDGQVSKAKVEDLLKIGQTWEAAEKRLEEAKQQSKQIKEEVAKKTEELQGHFMQTGSLIQTAEQLLNQEVGNIDWQKLREDDPAEYSAKKTEMAERKQAIDQIKQQALQSYQQAVEKQKAEEQESLRNHLVAEEAQLLEKLPEWREPEKAKAEKSKLVDYLTNQGFEQEDVMGASDHRLILIARKAMLYDELQGKSDVAKKKVAKVPKVVKPGSPKPQEQANRERIDKSKSQLRQTGRIEDAVAYLKQRRTS